MEYYSYFLNTFCRFKNYKDHLELCVKEYNDVVASIPPAMQGLFEPHIEKAAQNFHPGLTTLSWNSMNIGRCSVSFSKLCTHLVGTCSVSFS